MIFKLCVVTLGAVAILVGNVKTNCRIGYILDTSITNDIFEMAWPRTQPGKCVYECMLRLAGVLDGDGLIDADKFMQSLSETKKYSDATLKKMKTAVYNCKMHKHPSENKCATAGLFVQCTSEEATKHGLNATAISKAIHYVYYSLPAARIPSPKRKWPKGQLIFNWPVLDWWPKRK